MSSPSVEIEPKACSFQGKDAHLSSGTDKVGKALGALPGKAFKAHSPPDIQPNTRVLVVCGVADNITEESLEQAPKASIWTKSKIASQNALARASQAFSASKSRSPHIDKEIRTAWTTSHGLASPLADGWFFSDFYLFHHLFQNAGENQLWLTCEPPEILVAKYSQYLHGVEQDRRIVLDESLLPKVLESDNIRLFSRESLLEDFMRSLKSEANIAATKQQNILLLLFGYGDPATCGMSIGGRSDDPDNLPRLTLEMIKSSVLGLEIKLSLAICSGYSGGWLYSPNFDISAAANSAPTSPLLSISQSLGDLGPGSFWAEAVTRAFIKAEDQRIIQNHPEPLDEIDDDVIDSNTFAKLRSVIRDTLEREVDAAEGRHFMRFAA